ncbi:four-carbon acid sugar kinase family protein [Halomonas sp. TRM85114]|uniref:four-carbon acid sugar kinase family protein n=1 Tax=Halomonas jincaotanensis TaxID=2810616 RepID=UPI001BD63154|nr:four-carbon acid sugar kinase family protein [Halomonas jincaotanensis]MBS9402341.1 four-carbon acid sugar kinase family protein [Halomonas jincaotanensis]
MNSAGAGAHKQCRMAIVADDLTGALDAAAPFAQRGATTRVVVALERLEALLETWQEALPEVIAVTTESRHMTASEAAERVARATQMLTRLAPVVWFKKIDSTLRGQVVAESLAMRRVCGRRLILAPAVPSQGRTTREARIIVHGQRLETTDFARDARSRPPSGGMDALFEAEGLLLARHVPGQPLPTTDSVADAETDADLDALAGGIIDGQDAQLAVGAAGLSRALAHVMFGEVASRPVQAEFTSLWLAVGSRSERARQQVAVLRRAVPDLTVVRGTDDVPVEAPFLLLLPGTEESPREADEVAATLAGSLAKGMATATQRLYLMTGGDCASALMETLGASYLDVSGEWEPGVVLGYPQGNREWPLLTKAGGFGDESLLVRLLRPLA